MFVRFRKLKSDARHPRGIKFHGLETIQPTREYKGWTRSDGSLIHHPHVARIRGAHRQYIITNGHVALTPYTLEVSLAENRRVDGKVKQEHIATIGAIHAHMLPSFWEGLDVETVAALQADDWDYESMQARMRFWNLAKPKLERLANRIGDIKPIRMAIHRRIPWPMEAERNRLEGQHEVDFWTHGYEHSLKMLEANEKLIEAAEKQNEELRSVSMMEARNLAKAKRALDASEPASGIGLGDIALQLGKHKYRA